ncbi:hypothetical protein VSDG_07915 [Cytospora chrysosperma]|uniref:Transmembrane protein n=1 Tax=Cytospora chrysosperma TaxID=252740 RepID=A0A423VKX6_CYTCH|nr:hypothetical protein VSDG_07915 [Valsa sordida]
MRSRPLLYLLLLYTTAPTALLAAPVLPHLVLVKSLSNEAVSAESSSQPLGNQPPPTTVTLEGSGTVVHGPDHSRVAIFEEEESAQVVVIDNTPISLSPSQVPASGILSSARPLTTQYLQALSRLQSDEAQAEALAGAELQAKAEAEAPAPAQAQAQAAEAQAHQEEAERPEPPARRDMPVGSLVAPGSIPTEGVWHVQDVVVQLSDPPQEPPCAARHADVFVVGMALAFVMVILVVEMWGPVTRSIRRALGCEGAIRLCEDDRTAGRRALSFRDPDLEAASAMDEKRGGVQWGEEEEKLDEDDDEESGAEPWTI